MTDKEATVFEILFTPAKPQKNWSAETKAEWAAKRAFYSCHPENTEKGIDVMNYLFAKNKAELPDDEELREEAIRRCGLTDTVPDKSKAKDIEEYMRRFNTLGGFNLGGTMTQDELEEWRRGAQETKSTFWHGFLSLPFKQSLGVDNEKMQRLVRQTFGKFLRDAGLDPDNVALMCSIHNDKPHKHFHFVFYEKAPKYLDKYGNAQFKWQGLVPQEVRAAYRLSTAAYLDEHKEEFFSYRDQAMNLLRNITGDVRTDAELYAMMTDLSGKLPQTGRLQYNSEKIAPFREEIDSIAQALLRRNPEAYELHKKALKEIARRGTELKELKGGSDDYAKRMNEEYRGRLGNLVLGLIKQMRFDPKAKADLKKPETKKQHKAAARRRNTVGGRVIRDFIRSLDVYQAYLQTDFTKELERAEREIEQQNHRASGSE